MEFEFQPRPTSTVVAVLIGLVLLALAVWQMSRFIEKSALEDEWARRQAQEPIVMTSTSGFDADELEARRVRARGTLDRSRIAIVDHRRFRGEPGCFVLSPFMFEEGGTILALRGFVPHTRVERCEEAELSDPPSELYVGVIHTLSPNLADAANRGQAGTPLRWDTFDVVGTYGSWSLEGAPTTPSLLVLDESHVGDPFPLPSYEHVSAPYLTSMRHLNYAGTWLVLLLIVAGMWGALSLRRVDAAEPSPVT